jgi:membrane-bound lytic murein transglycosylase B
MNCLRVGVLVARIERGLAISRTAYNSARMRARWGSGLGFRLRIWQDKRTVRVRICFVVLLAFTMAATPWAQPAAGRPASQQSPQEGPPAPFDEWLAALRAEALAKGISQRTVDAALGSLEQLPVVVERDRTQAELTLTLDQYLKRRLTPRVVRTAREMASTHRADLQRAAAQFGVPRSVIVAVWGLESNFGRFQGVRPTIATLATLAYDGRRQLFRDELFAALRILDSGEVEPDALKGSWAGAMGQTQFMPSSYLKWSVDADASGRRDIWTSLPDIFGSIANYLKEHGWTKDQRWGREVRVSDKTAARVAAAVPMRLAGGCQAVRDMTEARPLSEWRALGVTQKNGAPLPKADLAASLVRVDTRRFLVYGNYEALLGYNCAHTYALSVAFLADRVGSR